MLKRIEQIAQHPVGLAVEAGAGLAGVDELARAVVVAEEQRADAALAVGQVFPAGDDELLLVEALGFDPGVAAARSVLPGGALGDGAFGMKLAGFVEDGRTVPGDVFGEA